MNSSPYTYLQDRAGVIAGAFSGPARAVAVSPNGRVWTGGESGLYLGTPRGYEIAFERATGFDGSVQHLLATPEGIWAFGGASLQLFADSDGSAPLRTVAAPENPLRLAYGNGSVWLLYPRVLMRVESESIELIETPGDESPRSLAFDPGGGVWLASGRDLRALKAGSWRKETESLHYSADSEIRDLAFDGRGQLWAATDRGILIRCGSLVERIDPADGLPTESVQSLALSPDGSRWFVLDRGIARMRDGEWRYFGGRRWLLDDSVRGIAPDGRGGVFAATEGGLAWIAAEPMTLAEKADRFQERLRARHLRHGYVSSSLLQIPGDPESFIYEASDNDGLWTALYVAAECFRYQVTGDPVAKANAEESMTALIRLEAVTPIPGFPARALIYSGDRAIQSDLEHGEWHPIESVSPDFHEDRNIQGEWKGDTSSDELDGHFFACAVFHDTFDDPEWRGRAASHARKIADHLIQNDFNLIDLDGKHTRWGFFSPSILNEPIGRSQRGLNSLEILSDLKTAYHLTGEERFQEAYLRLIREHHYALNLVRQKITTAGHVNHSDDELAFLAYYPLLRYETDPDLLALYRWSLRRSWEIERPERSPFFNYLFGAAMSERFRDADLSRRALEEIPLDIIHWTMRNGHRADLEKEDDDGRFGEAQSKAALSPAERGMLKWNGNPYRLDDGGGGGSEEDGAFFLLPYWMGRAFGFLPDG